MIKAFGIPEIGLFYSNIVLDQILASESGF